MKKILVIDDEPFARQVFSQVATNTIPDVEITEANDGMQAWDLIHQNHFDLIIVDVNLPLINGIELIEKMRSEPDLLDSPCIVITANTSSEVQEKVISLGVVEVISKIDVSSRVNDENPLVIALRKYLS